MYVFSRAVNSLHSEDIKLLMKQSSKKGLISFAAGMPNNDLFPVREIDEIFANLDHETKKRCFQYGPTSGYPPLIKSLETMMKAKGMAMNSNKLLITTGSLQAISIITQEFINEGDLIFAECPCFVGALSVFETYGAEIKGIPIDAEGIDIAALTMELQRCKKRPKFLYITPNFHNPAGIIYSEKRRKQLLEILSGTGIILIEDDAYGDLYFEEKDAYLTKPLKTYKGYDVDIIYTGSFSKILGPGFRLGYMISSEEIFEKAETIKQALDACTSNFMQILANEFISGGYLQPYLCLLRKEYAQRYDLLAASLEKYLPAEVTWIPPKGGFYVWLELPSSIKATDLFADCLARGVVFVTGRTFDPESTKDNRLRLSFSNMPKEAIEEGVVLLTSVIENHLKNSTLLT
ncbi:PLP-dependent aminotransferase family protein [Lutimonas sp.]|uniref:aminotransferase-like domain-containing protein n=1 Tax=Lutimonas sp. TaxID=1872403 RepID=UPI003D9AF2B3